MRHVIGYTRKGRPVYAIAGGSDGDGNGAGDGSGSEGSGGAGEGAGGAGTGDGTGSQGKPTEGAGDGSGGSGSGLDAEGQARELKRARDEAAKYRTERNAERQKLQQMETQLSGIQKALGLDKDGEPDPEALKAKLGEKDTKLRTLLTEGALRDAADEHGGDYGMLVPYLRGTGKLDGLDPESESFKQEVAAIVKDEVEKNPKLKAEAQGAGKGGASGSEFNGGSGGQRIFTREELQVMQRDPVEFEKHMDEINRQVAAGLIK